MSLVKFVFIGIYKVFLQDIARIGSLQMQDFTRSLQDLAMVKSAFAY